MSTLVTHVIQNPTTKGKCTSFILKKDCDQLNDYQVKDILAANSVSKFRKYATISNHICYAFVGGGHAEAARGVFDIILKIYSNAR